MSSTVQRNMLIIITKLFKILSTFAKTKDKSSRGVMVCSYGTLIRIKTSRKSKILAPKRQRHTVSESHTTRHQNIFVGAKTRVGTKTSALKRHRTRFATWPGRENMWVSRRRADMCIRELRRRRLILFCPVPGMHNNQRCLT